MQLVPALEKLAYHGISEIATPLAGARNDGLCHVGFATRDLQCWVRNLRDARVEVLAEGAHEALNRLLVELRKGPISAEVRDVDVEFTEAKGEFEGFRVRYTA